MHTDTVYRPFIPSILLLIVCLLIKEIISESSNEMSSAKKAKEEAIDGTDQKCGTDQMSGTDQMKRTDEMMSGTEEKTKSCHKEMSDKPGGATNLNSEIDDNKSREPEGASSNKSREPEGASSAGEVEDMPDSQMEQDDENFVVGSLPQGATAADEEKEEEEEEIPTEFPTTLEGFGYKYNEKGELKNIETGGAFEFAVKKNSHKYNQKRYEALGDVITDYIYELMEKEGLTRIHLPIDAKPGEPRNFIFATPDVGTNKYLLLLIHGAGAVRAGQWARRLIINDNLDSGTQLPYIRRAVENKFAVLVLNTNLNYREKGDTKEYIRGNEDPVKHGQYVWDKIISKLPAKHIAIVAHSFGGVVTVEMLTKHLKDMAKKVFAIALTDSVHIMHSAFFGQHKKVNKFFSAVAQNWVSSKNPLDTPMQKSDCARVSAGTLKHEVTSSSAFNSVFEFLKVKWAEKAKKLKSEEL